MCSFPLVRLITSCVPNIPLLWLCYLGFLRVVHRYIPYLSNDLEEEKKQAGRLRRSKQVFSRQVKAGKEE